MTLDEKEMYDIAVEAWNRYLHTHQGHITTLGECLYASTQAIHARLAHENAPKKTH